MKIILNGTVWVNDEELYFDGLEIEVGEDLDEFDFDDDCDMEECIEDCEDCGFCDCDEFEDEDDFIEDLEELLDIYTELLTEGCICPECVGGLLVDFLGDFTDIVHCE